MAGVASTSAGCRLQGWLCGRSWTQPAQQPQHQSASRQPVCTRHRIELQGGQSLCGSRLVGLRNRERVSNLAAIPAIPNDYPGNQQREVNVQLARSEGAEALQSRGYTARCLYLVLQLGQHLGSLWFVELAELGQQRTSGYL